MTGSSSERPSQRPLALGREFHTAEPRVSVTALGLQLGPGENPHLSRPEGGVVPLIAGSVHYWRLKPEHWRPALEAVRTLGCTLVDVYVPWNVHETGPGEVDLGRFDPRLDLPRFLRIAEEVGLFACVRPGPHINAELTWFGIPKRVIWDPECQARSATGRPVILPMLPLAFPVPSYASHNFLAETHQWYDAILPALAPLCWPDGPIVMVQVDNEGAFYFRDGVYDQDYHPDAVAQYRRFLQAKYHDVSRLREAHSDPNLSFPKAEPPRKLDAEHADELTRHLDWAEFQEHLLAGAMSHMGRLLQDGGLRGLPLSHNLPPADLATPLDPALLCEQLDLVGTDYYHTANEPQLRQIAYRTSELAARAAAQAFPCFAAELGAGFPPLLAPLRHEDNAFSAMSAMAYGLRAFNLYMAVDRDRWVGAPISPQGEVRPEATFWRHLIEAMERTRFAELERRVQVSIVVPRSYRRLARVLHAFGPVSQAAFDAMGRGITQSVAEAGVDLAGSAVVATQEFIDQVWDGLEALGVSVGIISGDLLDRALMDSDWVVIASDGALEPSIAERARAAFLESAPARGKVSVGPFLPTRDAGMRAVAHPIPEANAQSPVPWQLGSGPRLAESIARAVDKLKLARCAVAPPLRLTLHYSVHGQPRVAFVINPSPSAALASFKLSGVERATDCLTRNKVDVIDGEIQLEVAAGSVRMLELAGKA